MFRKPFLRKGDRGQLVETVQEALNFRECFVDGEAVAIDGYYGPQTESGIKLFQKRQGLEITGKLPTNKDYEVLIAPMKLSLAPRSARGLRTRPSEASQTHGAWLTRFFQQSLSQTSLSWLILPLLLAIGGVFASHNVTVRIFIKDFVEFILIPEPQASDSDTSGAPGMLHFDARKTTKRPSRSDRNV